MADNNALTAIGQENLCSIGQSTSSYNYDLYFASNPELCANLVDDLVVQAESCSGISSIVGNLYNKDCSIPEP